ncbi:MAG: CoB--CoM heterodisulfide reductase iron-sulfur subunit A family protein, partial [Clostridiaceae bacterium]|nr:CoB--CoM heterodisulfide reductase iron-sulfur subunit A family protein [Clostridiaceae bacterium]
MARVAIIGGGLAGCLVASELAARNVKVTIVEKSGDIGGKVINYGCKATDTCRNCGLCLVKDLWETVRGNREIEILTRTSLVDIEGEKGNYKVTVRENNKIKVLDEIDSIVVATGFENSSSVPASNLEINDMSNIITGSRLEEIIASRSESRLTGELSFPGTLKRVAFIQCFGSRDVKGRAPYCSRVCCAYSTRMAGVIRQYYPGTEITFFYMDFQWIEGRGYVSELARENIELVKCRPASIKSGVAGDSPVKIVVYEDLRHSRLIEREFDMVVLSEGIYPAKDTGRIAEICRLGQDENGFLEYVAAPGVMGIYIAGCAGGPKRI